MTSAAPLAGAGGLNEVQGMSKPVKPGQRAPQSGQYEEVGPRGGRTGHEVTISKGERVPPTRQPGGSFTIVDPTKNKSGRG
jgi:hypothetical protein